MDVDPRRSLAWRSAPCTRCMQAAPRRRAPTTRRVLNGKCGPRLAQIGLAKRIVYSGTIPKQPAPAASLDPTSAAYRAQADQVLAYSANLTQVYKLQVSPLLYKTPQDTLNIARLGPRGQSHAGLRAAGAAHAHRPQTYRRLLLVKRPCSVCNNIKLSACGGPGKRGRMLPDDGACGAQAEHFDSKVRSLGSPLFTLAINRKILDLQHLIFLFLTGDLAIQDANSEVWGQASSPSSSHQASQAGPTKADEDLQSCLECCLLLRRRHAWLRGMPR